MDHCLNFYLVLLGSISSLDMMGHSTVHLRSLRTAPKFVLTEVLVRISNFIMRPGSGGYSKVHHNADFLKRFAERLRDTEVHKDLAERIEASTPDRT